MNQSINQSSFTTLCSVFYRKPYNKAPQRTARPIKATVKRNTCMIHKKHKDFAKGF